MTFNQVLFLEKIESTVGGLSIKDLRVKIMY